MNTPTYSSVGRDRLMANVIVALPVLVMLGIIRYYQRPKTPSDSVGTDPALPL